MANRAAFGGLLLYMLLGLSGTLKKKKMAAMVDTVLLLMAVVDSLTMKGQLQLFVPKKSTLSGRISGRELRWRTKLAT